MADRDADKAWEWVLTGHEPFLGLSRSLLRWLPSAPRCKLCLSPFRGVGGALMKLVGKSPCERNPNVCGLCWRGLKKLGPGGAEVELSLLFADVRGSTALAERMTPREYRHLINRFFRVATNVFARSNAILDQMVGDEVIGLFLPGFTGPDHARQAIEAGWRILAATGHGDAGRPWLPVGVGVHTGVAFVGSLGSADAFVDFNATGDAVNVGARLAAAAAAGELLISEPAFRQAGLHGTRCESRQLALKGKSEPVQVFALREPPAAAGSARGLI